MQPGQMAGAGVFFMVWFFMMLGFTAGWVVFLVTMWRGMKAHEEIAEQLKRVVITQRGGSSP